MNPSARHRGGRGHARPRCRAFLEEAPTPAAKSRTEQDCTWRRRRRFLATRRTALVGATYLHAPSGRPVVVIDHEHRLPRADGTRARTGRVVVRYADTLLEILFVADPAALLEQLTLPYRRD